MSGRLPSLSGRQIISALRKAGFEDAPKRGKGSHHAMFHRDWAGRARLVIIPDRKDVPRGTLLAILEQAGLSISDFLVLLK